MSNTPFRPADIENASEGGAQYLGFQACAITEFEDQTTQFDWADLFLRVQLQIEGSQYPVDMKILGSYDREPNGNIKTCSLLKKWYRFADTVKFTGGPDVTGTMVDELGNKLNLEEALENHCQPHPLDPKMELNLSLLYNFLSLRTSLRKLVVLQLYSPMGRYNQPQVRLSFNESLG